MTDKSEIRLRLRGHDVIVDVEADTVTVLDSRGNPAHVGHNWQSAQKFLGMPVAVPEATWNEQNRSAADQKANIEPEDLSDDDKSKQLPNTGESGPTSG